MTKNDEGESDKGREIEGGGRIDRSSRGKFSFAWMVFFLNMQFSNIFRSYDDSRVAVY